MYDKNERVNRYTFYHSLFLEAIIPTEKNYFTLYEPQKNINSTLKKLV